ALDHQQQQVALRRQPGGQRRALAPAEKPAQGGPELGDADEGVRGQWLGHASILVGTDAISRACGDAADEPGEERLDDPEGSVPAGHVGLAATALERAYDVARHVLRLDDSSAEERVREDGTLREALRLDEARVDGVDADPAPAELGRGRARERELRVLRGRVRARGRKRDDARDRDDVHDVGTAGRLERRQEGAEAPDAPEVVRADELLEPLGLDVEEAAPAGDPGAAYEERDPR